GWLGNTPKVVVSLDVTDLSASALQQEVLELRRRVKKLRALLRLVLALLRSSGFTLTYERLPNRRAKIRILSAVDHGRGTTRRSRGAWKPALAASDQERGFHWYGPQTNSYNSYPSYRICYHVGGSCTGFSVPVVTELKEGDQ